MDGVENERDEKGHGKKGHGIETPGTMVLVLIFLTVFAIAFLGNLKWLATTWWVR